MRRLMDKDPHPERHTTILSPRAVSPGRFRHKGKRERMDSDGDGAADQRPRVTGPQRPEATSRVFDCSDRNADLLEIREASKRLAFEGT
jgi:hypothetical protein